MKKKLIFLFICLAFACLAAFFSYKIYQKFRLISAERVLLEKRKSAWANLKADLGGRILRFKGTVALAVKDLDTGWEINFNQDYLMPAASLVKIPIMLSYYYAASEGKINLQEAVYLRSGERVSGSKVLGSLPAGTRFYVEELFKPMITQSDNTATNALITLMGYEKLNAYFKKIGLKNTNIIRKMMNFSGRKNGIENYTTAADCAFLLERLYKNKFLSKDISGRCMILLGEQKINDRIPRRLPRDGAFVAHKTGLERHICHDVGIVYTRKGNFLICVLVKHNDKTAKNSKRFISETALLTYKFYNNL